MKYAIFVTIQLKPGMSDAFRPHIMKNAAAARGTEADCHDFQVMTAEDDPDRYYFYEVYSNKEALDFHRQTDHFQEYSRATGDMIADKVVKGCYVLDD